MYPGISPQGHLPAAADRKLPGREPHGHALAACGRDTGSMRAISNVLAEGSSSLSVSLTDGLLGVYFVWRE